MRTVSLVIALMASWATTALAQASLHTLLAPTVEPNVTQNDHWVCATYDLANNFMVANPRPTGALLTAHASYASQLARTCTVTAANGSVGLIWPCPNPHKSLWCSWSKAMPTSLLPEYTSYAKKAGSWWTTKSAAAVSMAAECPQYWYEAAVFGPGIVLGGFWLNQTLIYNDCLNEAVGTTTSRSTSMATPGATVSSTTPRLTTTSTSTRV